MAGRRRPPASPVLGSGCSVLAAAAGDAPALAMNCSAASSGTAAGRAPGLRAMGIVYHLSIRRIAERDFGERCQLLYRFRIGGAHLHHPPALGRGVRERLAADD